MVDSSVVAAFISEEDGWERFERYLRRWISVEHMVKEVTNAIWKHAVVKRLLSPEEAKYAYEILLLLVKNNIELRSQLELMDVAFDISLRRGVTVYDALYIVLAKKERVQLFTLDVKQARAAREEGVELLTVG